MGCSQSKASTDQVVERVSVDTPAVETPVPESIKTEEPVVDAPPASADVLPPAPASVPVEEAPKLAAPAEEPAAVEETEEPTVEEAPKTEEAAAPVDEVSEEAAAEELQEAPKTEEKTPEAESEEAPVEVDAPVVEEEAPNSEPAAEAPVEEAPVEAPVEEEASVAKEPTSEVVAAPVSELKTATEGTLTFKAEEVTFNDKGVAFYNFDGSDSSNPANDVHVSKRYSEFKALHAQLSQQLADNQDGKVSDLPALPKASLLQGRKNQKMLQDRKTQFTALLNAIAAHPVASQSDVFKAFLA